MDSHIEQQQQQQSSTVENAMINGTTSNGDDHSSSSSPVPNSENYNNGDVNNYDDLFPSLPSGATNSNGGVSSSNPIGEWNRKPKLVSSTVTQVFYIPMEERKEQSIGGSFGADDSHKTLKQVMDKSGAKIEMNSGKDQSLTFLITGKPDVVLKAKRELLVHFQTLANQTISIPKDHHRFILGKKGAKLQELEAKTSTKIQIPKESESSDKITITGPKEGIEKVLHEIRIISDEQSKQTYEVLKIPKIYHPFINGPNNETTKKLLTKYPNVRINIPPLSVQKDELSVAGETEGVKHVIEEINKIFKDMERKASTVSVEVKKSQHKYVIGPKGQTINDILASTGVFVEMPSSDSLSETITLRGPQEKLGLALTKVYEKANSVVSYDLDCPNWLHKYIIGKKGSSIQKLTVDLPKVHVEFLESGDSIKIEGPPEEADKARDALESQTKELKSKIDFAEISVDAKYHKHIIGKGGSTVNKIKQDSDVMIIIPDNENGSKTIRIEGNKEGVASAKKELLSMVSKMENERDKDLIIENRFHRQLIGPKGENIQKIRDYFSNVLISFPELGVSSDIVKLRGPKEDVDKCASTINKMYKDLLEANFQMKVPIFKQFHKFIIGKGGATIRKIRTETDTKVDLPESGSDSDVITITGRQENVLKAQLKITQIQTEMADVVSVNINIPSKIHNTIIGAGGKLIQSIMEDCGGVSIKFPPSDSNSDKVIIKGPKDDVEKAKKMLLELSNEKQLSSMSAEVRANPSHHKFLIGRNGANIQNIRDTTGARIIFPNEKDKDREIISILGTKEAVAAAKKELEARIKDLDNVVEETMAVDPKYHRHFVARRGEVLRNMSDEFGGVVVSFPRSGVISDQVTLKGAKDCVKAAHKRILEIVCDLENQVTIDCVIKQEHHRTVMGPRGSKVQKICSDHDVQIKFPEKASANEVTDLNNNNDVIRISGKSEKCEAAASALKALVPVNIEVDIPYEFHRYIIGQKGAGVRQLMNEFDVSIKVPPSDQQSNTIVITGVTNNATNAEQALKNKLKELEEEKADKALKSFEVKIKVDPEYHPKIIGRKGAVIFQLRKDYDVNIQLPKKESDDKEPSPEDSIITITGYEQQANKAKNAILKIVSDIESMTKEEVHIDSRVHSMIIGRKGAGIRKIMADYNVDIKLPRDKDPDPNLVQIIGQEENVLDCKDHLLNLEEEFMQEVRDKEWMEEYIRPQSSNEDVNANKKKSKGFEVGKGAPWQGASDDAFPTLGGNGSGGSNTPTPVWGPRKF